ASNFNGVDSFTYKASDGSLPSNLATVFLTVRPVNDAPVANGDSYTTNEDTTLTVSAPGILGNDSDVDSSRLGPATITGPAHATLTLSVIGSSTYTPASNFNGLDSFTYKTTDGSLQSGLATVTITVNPVNDRPVANADSYTVNEDNQLTVSAPGILG